MNAQNQIIRAVELDVYLQQLELEDLAPATFARRRQQVRAFHAWLGSRDPSAGAAKLYLAELRSRGYKRDSIASHYYAIKSYLNYMDIKFKVRLKRERRLPRYHSREDFQRILKVISERRDRWRRLRNRDRLIFRTLALSGLRRFELIALRCRDVKEGYLFVYRGKGDKDRTAPIPMKLSLEILDYIRESGFESSDRLFPIGKARLDHLVKGYALRAGIDDLTPHSLRHYFATRLIELGADLRKVQELLAHADIRTTAIYLDVIPEHLRKTIELLEDE
jgi:site-specific recombinase XerD